MWVKNLKAMKQKSGMTTREIAEKSGIPEPTLEKLFAGTTKNPKLKTLQELVHFFGYTLDDLVPDPEADKKSAPITQQSNERQRKEQKLLQLANQLGEPELSKLKDYADYLIAQHKK